MTPQTVLRWHRDIVRRRWADKSRPKRPERPRTHRNITASTLRLAKENPGWGYRRIHGELAGLGIQVAPSTVWEILTKAGIPPAPSRVGPTWTQFLHAQAQAILATALFTVELVGLKYLGPPDSRPITVATSIGRAVLDPVADPVGPL